VLITFGTIAGAVTCNYLGIDAVGWWSLFLAFFIIVPYAAFIVMALPHFKWDCVVAGYPPSLGRPHMARLLATMVWQFSWFDSLGALSGECANPRRGFPLAMFSIVALSTVQYLAVTVAGLSVEPDVAAWSCGGFARNAGKMFGGEWLGFALSAADALSAASLMTVTLSTSGREMWAGSVLNAFPCASYFARMRPNWKNDPLPIRRICYMACVILPLQFMNFGFLVDWSAFLGAIAQMIQTVIFFALRSPAWMARAQREIGWELLEQMDVRADEKFVIPGGWPVAIVLGLSLFGSCALLMIVTGWEAMLAAVAFVGGMLGIKFIDYRIRRDPWVVRPAPTRRLERSATV
jgi:amino acid transporter